MDPRLRTYLIHEITIAPRTGSSGDGSGIFGTPVTYPCRYVGKDMAVRKASAWLTGPGEENVHTFSVYMDASDAIRISPRDDVTVDEPHQIEGDAKAVIFTVSKVDGLKEIEYVKLSCGWIYHRQGQF